MAGDLGWALVKDLVDQALSLDSDLRSGFIASIANPALREEVQRYLSQHSKIGNFLGGVEDGSSRAGHNSRPRINIEQVLRGIHQGRLVMPQFRGEDRFKIGRRLGAGGFGEVYEAYDHALGCTVAMKAPHFSASAALMRFKREFRSLSGLASERLVALYDLFAIDDCWFFTMQYLDGMSLRDYLRSRESRLPIPQLRRMLADVVDGLLVLHGAGFLHRDMKPSNVWVTEAERLMLLDFGLVQEISADSSDRSLSLVGTPSYMSPEQAARKELSPASDWYSVGVMLYEVLTGQTPFTGDWFSVLNLKQQQHPVPPKEIQADIPEDLNALCCELLRLEPSERPLGPAILRRIGEESTTSIKVAGADPVLSLVGRSAEQGLLDLAWRQVRDLQRPAAVVIRGESGIGKTALVSDFVASVQSEPGTAALTGRCYASESVPFKALDDLVDATARFLMRRRDSDALLPRNFPLLSTVFPALQRLGHPGASISPDADSLDIRRRAFSALWELYGRVAERTPLLLWIDDLQWGDLDSAPFFTEYLLGSDAPPLLLVLSFRSEDAELSPLLQQLAGALHEPKTDRWVRSLTLSRLTEEDGCRLARALMGLQGDQPNAETVAALVSGAEGSPFFIHQFIRHRRSTPATLLSDWNPRDVLRSRLEKLSNDATRLLRLVAVAGRPTAINILRQAEAGDFDLPAARKVLLSENVLRSITLTDSVDVYHDKIREAVLERIDDALLRDLNARLALAFETEDGVNFEQIAEHYAGARSALKASHYGELAGDRARASLAFERAAYFYKLALDQDVGDADARRSLLARRAEALGRDGRGQMSAQVFLEAAEDAPFQDQLRFRTGAISQFLRSGHLTDAISLMPALMSEVGLRYPKSRNGVIAELLLARARLRLRGLKPRQKPACSLEELARMDICWSLALGICMVDPLRSALFCAEHLRMALNAADTKRIAIGFAGEATQRAFISGGGAIANRMMANAASAAETIKDAHTEAFVVSMQGMLACLRGEWKRSLELGNRAAAMFRECRTGPGWELTTTVMYTISMRFLLGDWKSMVAEMPALLRESDERGEQYASLNFQLLTSYYYRYLLSDEPDQAVRLACDLLRQWNRDEADVQQYYAFTVFAEAALYDGDGDRAWEQVELYWRGLKKNGVFYLSFARIFGGFIRAKCAVLKASRPHLPEGKRDRFFKEALKIARALESEPFRYVRGLALLIRATVAIGQRNRNAAIPILRSAIDVLSATDMIPWRVSAEYRLGKLTQDRAQMEAAVAWMRAQDCVCPERLFDVFVPGEREAAAL